MIPNIEKSVKASVKKAANQNNMEIAELWQLIVMERFLARLVRSEYKEHFVLKGGMLLTNYLKLERETRDLDFLLVQIGHHKLGEVFQKIIEIELDDHFIFSEIIIEKLPHLHLAYQGNRVNMKAHFGKVRFKVSIDIGFNDIVYPSEKLICLSGLETKHIPKPEISMKCYPPEFIFAEKYHAITFLGGANSRMKDFYDLFLMIQEPGLLDQKKIISVLNLVFNRRKTPLEIPLKFSTNDMQNLQGHWGNFIRQLGKDLVNRKTLPVKIDELIMRLNQWFKI